MIAHLYMADVLERWINKQSDADWNWGPFLYLRPPKNVRLTLKLWLTIIGFTVLFALPAGAALGALLAYYDYTSSLHHARKIPPVIVTENLADHSSPRVVFACCASAVAMIILAAWFQHWAWNRRADRLNREPKPETISAALPGIWPPAPSTRQN